MASECPVVGLNARRVDIPDRKAQPQMLYIKWDGLCPIGSQNYSRLAQATDIRAAGP